MFPGELNNIVNVINGAITEALSNTHTATIAKVTKIDGSTISAKPVFKRVVNEVEIDLPEFSGIPVFTLQGGNNYRIMPISVGDYALLVFSERCIDDWFVGNSDNKRPREFRMHDYSDAIAIVGLHKLQEGINIPTGHEEVKGNIVHEGNLRQVGTQDITGDVTIVGNLEVDGNIICTGNISAASFSGLNGGAMAANVNIVTTGDVTAGNISTRGHTHTTNTDGETSTAN